MELIGVIIAITLIVMVMLGGVCNRIRDIEDLDRECKKTESRINAIRKRIHNSRNASDKRMCRKK